MVTSTKNARPRCTHSAPISGSDREKVRSAYACCLGSHTTAVTERSMLESVPKVWPGSGVSPMAGTEVPCPLTASTPPRLRAPGAGQLVIPRPAACNALCSTSMAIPVCAVTVGGDIDVSIETAVKCAVVSRSSTGVSQLASGSTEIGAQLCVIPRGRSRQPFACAQLASVTTS